MARKRWGARVGLLFAYLGAGFLVIWFFGAGGHGTLLTLPILFSGGLIPPILLSRLLGPVLGLLLLLISPPAYFAFLIYLNTIFSNAALSRIPWVTVTIHALGSILGLIIVGGSAGRENDPVLDLIGVIVSAVLVLAYLESDWLLAGGRIQPPPKGPYWDLGSS